MVRVKYAFSPRVLSDGRGRERGAPSEEEKRLGRNSSSRQQSLGNKGNPVAKIASGVLNGGLGVANMAIVMEGDFHLAL